LEEYYGNLINNLTIGASVINNNGQIIFVNDAYSKGIMEEKDFMLRTNMYSPEYNKKLSVNIFRTVMERQHEVRERQVYVNEQGFAYNVTVFEKPVFKNNKVEYVLAYAENIVPLARKRESHLAGGTKSPDFICESAPMRQLEEQLRKIVFFPTNILLIGETGVGKDVVAEFIHRNSYRWDNPFVAVNCAAISETLIEAELFGYEKGSFTGASMKGKKGLVEQADGGTLFLDEINSLPLSGQGNLLRAIEKKTIRRIGATEECSVDFHLITASNEDLETCVKNKTFREDLYYRINVITKRIPPLRERKDDIIPLAIYFTQVFCKQYHIDISLTSDIFDKLLSYDWPGNVRELKNYIEHYIVTGDSSTPNSGHPGDCATVQKTAPTITSYGSLKEMLAEYEKEIIKDALRNSASKGEAAKKLGIDPAVLSRKIFKYRLI